MLIQKMRAGTSSLLAKIIVVFIIIAFAFIGLDSFIGLSQQESSVAEINGKAITQYQFTRAVNRYRQDIINHYGENFDVQSIDEAWIAELVLQQLIQQETINQAIKQRNIKVSDETLVQTIQAIPALQDNEGKFDTGILKTFLASQGLTFAEFQETVAKEINSKQLNNSLVQTNLDLDNRLAILARIVFEKRDINYPTLNTDPFRSSVKPTKTELRAYFNQHQTTYIEPAKVKIKYISYKPEDLSDEINISEQDLELAYQARQTTLEEQLLYQPAHILIKT